MTLIQTISPGLARVVEICFDRVFYAMAIGVALCGFTMLGTMLLN